MMIIGVDVSRSQSLAAYYESDSNTAILRLTRPGGLGLNFPGRVSEAGPAVPGPLSLFECQWSRFTSSSPGPSEPVFWDAVRGELEILSGIRETKNLNIRHWQPPRT
jgi:hypothetical protein